MMAWEMPLSLTPWNFNNLNSYNSTKDFLFNTQAHLRDPHIEASKGGQVGTNRTGEKGEKLRLAMEPGAQKQGSVQRGEEAGCGWHFLHLGGAETLGGHSCRSEQCELWLSWKTLARTQHGVWPQLLGSGQSRKRNKAMEHCCLVDSPNSPSVVLGIGLRSTLSANRRTVTTG